ncbi:MAG TPA: energy transducer TonB [Myxococcaceae bacterium]|nr:energy transducer TonB [Myxococcaceae bacterium]
MVKPELERTRRRKARRRTAVALLLAVGGHGLLAVLLAVASALWPAPPPERLQQVALHPISANQWAHNREITNPDQQLPPIDAPDVAEREPERPEPEKHPRGQSVDVAPGNQQESKDARYLAPTANKVDRETRAREQTAFYKTAMPQRTRQTKPDAEGTDPVDQVMRNGNGGLSSDLTPQAPRGQPKAAFELPSVQRRDEIHLRDEGGAGAGVAVANRTGQVDVRGNSNRLLVRPGQGSGGEGTSAGRPGVPGLANLTPSPGALNKITGAAPNDYLDLDEGDGTFLNTKEWKYSGFFNRVKQSVATQWNPGSALHVRDPTGNIYGGHDRFTLLQVTLDDQGTVKNISVEKSCGVDFLDLEAVHSFERVSRFPNPPPGLLEADATVRFEFGFFLDYSGGPKLRLFRSEN